MLLRKSICISVCVFLGVMQTEAIFFEELLQIFHKHHYKKFGHVGGGGLYGGGGGLYGNGYGKGVGAGGLHGGGLYGNGYGKGVGGGGLYGNGYGKGVSGVYGSGRGVGGGYRGSNGLSSGYRGVNNLLGGYSPTYYSGAITHGWSRG